MSAFGFVTAWANAPFAIAAGVAALFALLQLTGLLGMFAGGAETDHDVDHDVSEGAGSDGADGHDGGHEGEHDAGDRGWGAAALAPLGAGKIPFSMIWQTYALAFALTGYALNLHYFAGGDVPPAHSLAWTVPIALAFGYAAVALTARLLGPVFATKEQEATSRANLVGHIGVVISSRVDQEFGEDRIRDKTGHDVRVICKLPPGPTKPALEHQSVVVVDYDAERGDLIVEPLGDGFEELGRKEH